MLNGTDGGSGASASAALWAGLPIVCKTGKGFITRVTASMLSAIGMHELITETVQDYEALILDLATNPKRLASIKRKLENNRLSTPLFLLSYALLFLSITRSLYYESL